MAAMANGALAVGEGVAATGRRSENRLMVGPVRPLLVPLWLGAERRGAEAAPAAIAAGLRRRWGVRDWPELLGRLAADETVAVEVPVDAGERLDRRRLEFLPEVAATAGRLAEGVAAAIGEGALALAIGGDHALSAGSIAGAARAAQGVQGAEGAGRLGVLWLDTHPDLNTPVTSPSGHLHGMALAAALGLGAPALAGIGGAGAKVRPEDVCLLGVRDIDPGERRLMAELGIWALTMEEWTDAGVIEGLEGALRHLEGRGVAAVHLSFDLDVLDPKLLPGTGTTVAGGLTYREASRVLRRLRAWEGPIRSADWVELNPSLDPSGWSTATATALLATLLGETMR